MEIISPPHNWQVKKRRHRHKLIIYLLSAILIVYFILRISQPSIQQLISPLINFQSANLKDAVEKALEGNKGTYGIVIKDLKKEERYTLNEHQVFEVGSLYKLWVMAEAFDQVHNGQLKEDEVLSESNPKLNAKFNISSESAELKEGTITLSVKDALNQMITISHNQAALLLTEKVKLSKVARFLKEKGFNDSKVATAGGSPTSTPADIALFLEKLYTGNLINSQGMLELLKKQQLNNKLPKGLPNRVSIAHKTGEIGYFTHDAGIVFTPKTDYIIVVLSESDYPPGAEDRISQISKSVYDYFERK